jgi:hypothetical protein
MAEVYLEDKQGEKFYYGDEDDFIAEIGGYAWENGVCIDGEDVNEAIEYAREELGFIITLE